MQNGERAYLLGRCSLSCGRMNKTRQNQYQSKNTQTQFPGLHQLHLQATLTPTQRTVALNRGCRDPLLLTVSLSKTFNGELVL